MKLKVEQRHIDAAIKARENKELPSTSCPIVQAAREINGFEGVTWGQLSYYVSDKEWLKMAKFAEKFDFDRESEPTEFELSNLAIS